MKLLAGQRMYPNTCPTKKKASGQCEHKQRVRMGHTQYYLGMRPQWSAAQEPAISTGLIKSSFSGRLGSDLFDTSSNDKAIERVLTIYRNGIGRGFELWKDENRVRTYVHESPDIPLGGTVHVFATFGDNRHASFRNACHLRGN
jgi:hypothetical protein